MSNLDRWRDFTDEEQAILMSALMNDDRAPLVDDDVTARQWKLKRELLRDLLTLARMPPTIPPRP